MDEEPTPDAIRALLGKGESLLAYDESLAALAQLDDESPRPQRVAYEYLAVLALARSGASDRAMQQFRAFGLNHIAVHEVGAEVATDVAALEARVAKDRALASSNDNDRHRRAVQAATMYEAIFRELGGTYPCINAATMWLVAGDAERSRQLADITRTLCAKPQDAEDDYWHAATEAEAALLLADVDQTVAALARADRLSPGEYATRATTRKQLRLICGLLDLDPAVLDPLTNPTVMHYAGHRISVEPGGRFSAEHEPAVRDQIGRVIDGAGIGFGFGSLASGADILFAETLLERGHELHVVLPFGLDEFIATSVADAGAVWVGRFHACLDRATSVEYASDGDYLGENVMFDFCARVAMGVALQRAMSLETQVRQVVVWDGEPPTDTAGTAVDIATWTAQGWPVTVISPRGETIDAVPDTAPRPDGTAAADPNAAAPKRGRVTRAMLFADIAGFSKLSDSQIPRFVDEVMQPLAEAIDRVGDAVLLRQTWGDGLYLVFSDVESAAQGALELQAAMRSIDLTEIGLGALRGMRIGGHVGPVFEGIDPVRNEINFFGANVTRAARIEPRTPEGEVYVTRPFAALLALEQHTRFVCEYVGHIPAAKDYGILPMFVLKTAG